MRLSQSRRARAPYWTWSSRTGERVNCSRGGTGERVYCSRGGTGEIRGGTAPVIIQVQLIVKIKTTNMFMHAFFSLVLTIFDW